MDKPMIDARPSRRDLTSRECGEIMGSLLGGLCLMAKKKDVRTAIQFWADNDEVWEMLPGRAEALEFMRAQTKKERPIE